jgi:hypothetical protein
LKKPLRRAPSLPSSSLLAPRAAEARTTRPWLSLAGTTGICPRISVARRSSVSRSDRGLLTSPREKPCASTTVTPL